MSNDYNPLANWDLKAPKDRKAFFSTRSFTEPQENFAEPIKMKRIRFENDVQCRQGLNDYPVYKIDLSLNQHEIMTLETELEKSKAEAHIAIDLLEQTNLDLKDAHEQLNRAYHQLELKNQEIKRLENNLETQASTLTGYIESNLQLEAKALQPCNCLVKTEIACESFRQSTNQTLIRWATACLIILAILTYSMYPKL